jgi:hypothetical protein
MADDKGKNWALPSSADGAVAYRRPVKLLLRSHSVVMMAGSAGNRPVTIALNDPRAGLEELVRAIWVRMESWGIAGVSGYWIPQLNVVVEPGAELRFEQMKRMLHDSGVEIREYQP